tara:strand:- start:85 stop:252 length:168 start_codon:yes stop_codon:yes gene_type:complete
MLLEKEVRFDVGLLFFCADKNVLARDCSILVAAALRDESAFCARSVKKNDIFRVI